MNPTRTPSGHPAPPKTTDERNLDPRRASTRGEGAATRSAHPEVAWPVAGEDVPRGDRLSTTYYDLPVVKPAPWKWYVPAYFYTGGLAGAAATLAAAAEIAGDAPFARRLHAIATAGDAAGAACLIADLGKPALFHHMMRVFRPTSPMNLGTWILSAASASGALALLDSLRRRHRGDPRDGRRLGVASAASAVSGAMLSTYTGVLIGNTAIPIWSATRRRLPLWFAASSAASLASLLELIMSFVPAGPAAPAGRAARATRSTRRYALAGKAAEVVGAYAVERAAETAGVARPLREGRSGRMWRGARWLGLASLVATVLGRSRSAGVLGTAAAVLARFALIEAGKASAADPRATFEPQRRAPRAP